MSGRTRRRHGVSLLILLTLISSACDPAAEPTSTAPRHVGTAASSTITSTAAPVTPPPTTMQLPMTTVAGPTTTAGQVGPDLVFPEVDMGVATTVRQLTLGDPDGEVPELVESADGAVFLPISCIATWPNRWEITGEWTPAAGAPDGPSDWVLGVSLMHGDVVAGAAAAEVTLARPGLFTIPLAYDSLVPWFHAQRTSRLFVGDRPFGPGPQCQLDVAAGSQPVDVDHLDYQSSFVSSEARFVPPLGMHSPGTLQGELEEMTDPKEHWLGALAWHVGLEGAVPFDVLYLRPDEKIMWLRITREPPCVGVAIAYEDEVLTGQAAGCPPGSEPLDRFDASELVEMDNGWVIAATGFEPDLLVAYPWEGAEALRGDP